MRERNIVLEGNITIRTSPLFSLSREEISDLFPFMKKNIVEDLCPEIGEFEVFLNLDTNEIMTSLSPCIRSLCILSTAMVNYFLPNMDVSKLKESKELQKELILYSLFIYNHNYNQGLGTLIYHAKEFISHFPFLKN